MFFAYQAHLLWYPTGPLSRLAVPFDRTSLCIRVQPKRSKFRASSDGSFENKRFAYVRGHHPVALCK
jgi:hypothetical protein